MTHQLSDSELKNHSEDVNQEFNKRTKNNAILPKLVNELVFLALQEQSAATKNQILYLALLIAQIKNHSAPLLNESKISITLNSPDELEKITETIKDKDGFHKLLGQILAPLRTIERDHQRKIEEINANFKDDKTKYEYHKNIIDKLTRLSASLFLSSFLFSLPLLAIQYLALTHISPILFTITGILAGVSALSLLLTGVSAILNGSNEKNPYQLAISRENNSFFKDKKAKLIHVNNGTINLCETHLQSNTP
jgi:hypothetical protein